MDSGLLVKLFGNQGAWHGGCTILLDAAVSVNTSGPDSIISGGTKVYAPRLPSGRVAAEALSYLPSEGVLLLILRDRQRQQTGEEFWQERLLMVNVDHVAGLEFEGIDILGRLGIGVPPLRDDSHYAPGTLVG